MKGRERERKREETKGKLRGTRKGTGEKAERKQKDRMRETRGGAEHHTATHTQEAKTTEKLNFAAR